MCKNELSHCPYNIKELNVEFKVVRAKANELLVGCDNTHHTLVFLLDGALEFSYNEYLHHRFLKNDLFFLPQSAETHGTSLSDNTRMVVMKFNNQIKTLCHNCRVPNFDQEIKEIVYDFRPLKMSQTIIEYLSLVELYTVNHTWCHSLHEVKQQELFILLHNQYSRRQMLELFYPIAGGSLFFKARILEHYAKGLSVQELAKVVGMGYSSFLRKFKKEFGESAQEWMQNQKAKHIQLRLSIPSTSIADIVFEFGFSDASHFSRYCRRQFGCTPGKLIKRLQEGENDPSAE